LQQSSFPSKGEKPHAIKMGDTFPILPHFWREAPAARFPLASEIKMDLLRLPKKFVTLKLVRDFELGKQPPLLKNSK